MEEQNAAQGASQAQADVETLPDRESPGGMEANKGGSAGAVPVEETRESLREDFFKRARAQREQEAAAKEPEAGGTEQKAAEAEAEADNPPKSAQNAEEKKSKANARIRGLAEDKKRLESSNKSLVERNSFLEEQLKKYAGQENLTVKDQVDVAQIQAEQARIREKHVATVNSYIQEQGELGRDFGENYNYYVPVLNRECPDFLEELVLQGGDSYPFLLDKFMEAINEGTESIEKWKGLPKPAIRAQLRKIVDKTSDFINNPQNYLTPEQIREIDPNFSVATAAPPPKQASIVPKQTKAQPNPQYSGGSYFEKLVQDKLAGRR